MGKLKKSRQKYHLSLDKVSDKNKTGLYEESIIEFDQKSLKQDKIQSWNVQPSDNIFSGLDIDINNLKRSLLDVDDDGKSVRSISKSIKSSSGSHLKKADKRKLRHNLFIQKIDAIYEKIKESKKKKKKKKNDIGEKSTVEYLLDKNPVKVKNTPQISMKQRGIKKAKQRKEIMLKDIDAFKRILKNPNYVAEPLKHIRNTVQNKVMSEIV